MMTAATALLPDPFRYGYRLKKIERNDGSIDFEHIPLTLFDLLHPEVGDVVGVSSLHGWTTGYLSDVFRAQTQDQNALVLADTIIDWHHPEFSHHSPDIAVIFGVRKMRENWTRFDTRIEGVRPRLIVEVVSPDYASNDTVTKLIQYHKAKVPCYVIIDRRNDDTVQIQAYQWTPRKYVPLPADEAGRIWLDDVRVWIAPAGARVQCFDENDQPLGDYAEVSKQLAEAERQAAEAQRQAAEAERLVAAERARAAQAEERIRQLEAMISRTSDSSSNP